MQGKHQAEGTGAWPPFGKRPRKSTAALLAVVLAALVMSGLAGATNADVFELEGNTGDSPAGIPFDWTTFFDSTGQNILPRPSDFKDSGFKADHFAAPLPDTSTFTGGSKDILDVSAWSCTDSNNLGGKFDIVNAYGAIYEVPVATANYGVGDVLLFFGIERAATEGDGAMGFWFLKNGAVDCAKTGGGKAPAFTGTHTDGDVFVVAGFSNGGANASVTAYKWLNGALDIDNPFVSGTLCGASQHDACGIVNTSTLPTDTGKPWPSPDKNGGDLDVNAFYEGFVRVPAATAGGCFATFVANTRSSTSPTSTIHDFSRGTFPTCRPSTSLDITASAAVTYTFVETNDGNTPLTPPNPVDRRSVITFSGQTCTVTALAYVSGDTNNNSILDPAEAWSFTCTGTVAGPTDTNVSNSTVSTLTGIGHGCDTTGRDVTAATTGSCTDTTKLFTDSDERDRVEVTVKYFPRGPN